MRLMPPSVGNSSPWGEIQAVETIAVGLVVVVTAGHGGYWVSPELRERIPSDQRTWAADGVSGAPGWFEEDCAAAFVAAALPEFFPTGAAERAAAFIPQFFPGEGGMTP